jgi:hypothetical protein
MAAKFGAYGKICLIAFVTSITDVLDPCAALPPLTQLSTIFHLPASLNTFRLSPSTHILIVGFFDRRPPLTRAPRKILTSWVDSPWPLGCPQMKWSRALKKALESNDIPTEFVKFSYTAMTNIHVFCSLRNAKCVIGD